MRRFIIIALFIGGFFNLSTDSFGIEKENSIYNCSEYEEVEYSKPSEYSLSRIDIIKLEENYRLPIEITNSKPEKSKLNLYKLYKKEPDFTKKGPWNTELYIFGNKEKPFKTKIVFRETGNYGVREEWINEKLLFIEVFWGRIGSTQLILNAEKSEFIYIEDANYAKYTLMSCEEKIRLHHKNNKIFE